MPSASMNRLMDNARVRLPGAIDATILAELFSVVKDFCDRSNVWQMQFSTEVLYTELSPLSDPDAFTYSLYPPTGAKIVRLLGTLDARNFRANAQLIEPNAILLDRSPNEDTTYYVTGVLTVTDPVTRTGEPMAPDWLIEKYNDALLDGVLGRMMSQAAKPYTSTSMGAFHYSLYRSAISKARLEAERGNVYGSQAWRFPRGYSNNLSKVR